MAALIELYRRDHAALVAWAVKEYGLQQGMGYAGNRHRVRRQNMADRLNLYRDKPQQAINALISRIYTTPKMQDALKPYVDVACDQNVSSRIVNEIACLYDRTTLRILSDRNDQFQTEAKRLNLQFFHQEASRLATLCNEVLLWQFRGIDERPTFRIITPDCFDALPDPRDQLRAAGYLIDAAPIAPLNDEIAKQLPNYELWDDTYRYQINAYGRLVDDDGTPVVEPQAHGLGRIPGVLFHRREPTTAILDDSYGEDIKSAHLGVALLNVMIMRLSKVQGENQPVLQGNLARVATGQVMDGEQPLALPPDVVASVLNMKTDPDHYLAVKRDKIASVAQRYGMSYEQFTLTAAPDSGKAYQVRREKLIELRLEQRARALVHEAMVVELMGFPSEGMRVDFQEQTIPLDAAEEVSLLDDKMRKGLDSPIAYLQRKDPDMSREDAEALLQSNLADYAWLINLVRALNMPGGGDGGNPGKTPQQNGAMGGRPSEDEKPKADVVKDDEAKPDEAA